MLFRDNAALCSEVTEHVVQHFVRCIETHGRHMQYLKFLQTIVKSENTYIRKCQDMVMSVVIADHRTHIHHHTTPQPFYGPFSGTTRASWCQKRTSGLYGVRED